MQTALRERSIPINSINEVKKYYPALDGLRGLAILLIVFYHNFGFISFSFFGWLGVDLFFVLSGYLITNILLKTRNKANYFRNFYIRRILRIAPLYYLALILFLLIIPSLTSAVKLNFYIEHQWWFWTYLQNWLLIRPESFDKTTALHHFWSLAVEEQFYLLWPWLILIIKKPKHLALVILALLLLVIATRTFMWINKIKGFNYFGFYTFTRIDGLCIGSLLAVFQFMNAKFLRRYSTVTISGLAILNFIFYFINLNNNFPYLAMIGYTTLAVIFALLVYEAINQDNKLINFILQSAPLVFFGRISYGLYVFHWPVYALLHSFVYNKLIQCFSLSDSVSEILTASLITLAGIGVSILSFNLFEKHFLKLKQFFT